MGKKLTNSNELLNLKRWDDNNSSIDNALSEFKKMEASFGRLTITDFEKNPERLSPYQRKVLEDWVTYLNQNIPEDDSAIPNAKKIDSILSTSKTLLAEAKINDARKKRFLEHKEKRNKSNRFRTLPTTRKYCFRVLKGK